MSEKKEQGPKEANKESSKKRQPKKQRKFTHFPKGDRSKSCFDKGGKRNSPTVRDKPNSLVKWSTSESEVPPISCQAFSTATLNRKTIPFRKSFPQRGVDANNKSGS